jgi:hypothetical protein
MSEPAKSNWGGDLSGYVALACLAAVIFSFLNVDTQRRLYSRFFRPLSIPQGSYSPVSVLSSNREVHSFGPDKFVVTVRISTIPGDPDAKSDISFPDAGIRYTLECVPHFWNLCTGLVPGHDYYGRWVTSERKQLAMGETLTSKDGKSYVAREKTWIFDTRGWQQAAE